MSAASRIASVLRREGEPVTLTLMDEGEPEATLTNVRAKRQDAQSQDVAGSMRERTVTFRIAGDELALHSPPLRAPRRLDTITDGDSQVFVIDSVDTRKRGARVLMHIIRATGDT